MTKSQEIIEPRVASYIRCSWYARWVIIAIVGISFLFMSDVQRPVAKVLLLGAVFYNTFMMMGGQRGWRIFTNQPLMLLADGLLALTLIINSGGVSSPYLLLLSFMIVSSAYWYGPVTAVMVGVSQSFVLIAYEIMRDQITALPQTLIMQMAVFTTIGVYVSWLTGSEHSERNQLVSLSAETEKERQQLLALINNMRDAVIVVDNDDRIVIHNQAAAALAAVDKNLQNRSVNEALRFLDTNNRPTGLDVKHIKNAGEQDLLVQAPDGSLINALVSVAPYIVDRRSRGHVLIIHDNSQEKTITREREEFIAVASHELRTPLTIAQSALSFVMTPQYLPKNQDSIHMLNSTQRSLQQLSHIISDLTNLSQVQNEQLDVQLEPLNPVALLHDFQADYDGQAKSKGLELKVIVDPKLSSATILTSRYIVNEILSIYVSNALKFTDKGTITLSVMNPEHESAGVTFAISDTGIGVSQSDQKKIFEKFFQSEDYSTRVHGGTGLGLYIAKRLAQRITAKIWFKTELGKGSTFYLWVPPYSRHSQDLGKVATAETKDLFNSV